MASYKIKGKNDNWSLYIDGEQHSSYTTLEEAREVRAKLVEGKQIVEDKDSEHSNLEKAGAAATGAAVGRAAGSVIRQAADAGAKAAKRVAAKPAPKPMQKKHTARVGSMAVPAPTAKPGKDVNWLRPKDKTKVRGGGGGMVKMSPGSRGKLPGRPGIKNPEYMLNMSQDNNPTNEDRNTPRDGVASNPEKVGAAATGAAIGATVAHGAAAAGKAAIGSIRRGRNRAAERTKRRLNLKPEPAAKPAQGSSGRNNSLARTVKKSAAAAKTPPASKPTASPVRKPALKLDPSNAVKSAPQTGGKFDWKNTAAGRAGMPDPGTKPMATDKPRVRGGGGGMIKIGPKNRLPGVGGPHKTVPHMMLNLSDDKGNEDQLDETVLDAVDDDGFMAKRQLYDIAKRAIELHSLIQDTDNLEPWVQAKITTAADYIDNVYHSLEYDAIRDAEDVADELGLDVADFDDEDVDYVEDELYQEAQEIYKKMLKDLKK